MHTLCSSQKQPDNIKMIATLVMPRMPLSTHNHCHNISSPGSSLKVECGDYQIENSRKTHRHESAPSSIKYEQAVEVFRSTPLHEDPSSDCGDMLTLKRASPVYDSDDEDDIALLESPRKRSRTQMLFPSNSLVECEDDESESDEGSAFEEPAYDSLFRSPAWSWEGSSVEIPTQSLTVNRAQLLRTVSPASIE